MAHSKEKLGLRKESAIIALCSTRSIEEASRTCKTPVRTLYRWLKEPDFDEAYRKARSAAFGQSVARLHYLSGAAVSTLGKVMLDPATPPAAKIRAADSILSHTAKAVEIEDLQARLTNLEMIAASARAKGSDFK